LLHGSKEAASDFVRNGLWPAASRRDDRIWTCDPLTPSTSTARSAPFANGRIPSVTFDLDISEHPRTSAKLRHCYTFDYTIIRFNSARLGDDTAAVTSTPILASLSSRPWWVFPTIRHDLFIIFEPQDQMFGTHLLAFCASMNGTSPRLDPHIDQRWTPRWSNKTGSQLGEWLLL